MGQTLGFLGILCLQPGLRWVSLLIVSHVQHDFLLIGLKPSAQMGLRPYTFASHIFLRTTLQQPVSSFFQNSHTYYFWVPHEATHDLVDRNHHHHCQSHLYRFDHHHHQKADQVLIGRKNWCPISLRGEQHLWLW